MSVKYFGMYSDEANMAVEALVNFAKVANLTWPETKAILRTLADSDPDAYGEAMDTVVREMVYDAIGANKRDEVFYC